MSQANQNQSDTIVPPDLRERYSDIRMIASGGMGQIFSAHDGILDKRVALKVLPPRSDSADVMVRFQQEAKALSKLKNKYVVDVYDFGLAKNGQPFLVMELIEGESLAQVIEREKKFDVQRTLDIAVQICTGLEHAHAQGVIHRDLTPRNIMLQADDRVKILDFGIAKFTTGADTEGKLTKSGQLVGSPLFMTPEQIAGEEANARTDVYGLGLLLFKMFSGEAPFANDNLMDVFRKRLAGDYQSLDLDDPQLSAQLNEILAKALKRNAEERYSSMSEFREVLERLATKLEQQVTVSQSVKKVPAASIRINKMQLVLLACVAVGLILGMVPLFIAWNSSKLPEKKIQVEPVERKAGIDKSKKASMPKGFTVESKEGLVCWHADATVNDADMEYLDGKKVEALIFDVKDSIVTDEGLKHIVDLPIRYLDLSQTHVGDGALVYVGKLKKIDTLILSKLNITNKGLESLKDLLTLKVLEVSGCQPLNDGAVDFISKNFPNMQDLDIGDCGITKKCFKYLFRLPRLNTLTITTMNLQDEDLEPIYKLRLSSLDLACNKLTDKIMPRFKDMKRLTYLEVTHNLAITEDACIELQRSRPRLKIARTTKPETADLDASAILEMQEEGDKAGPSSGDTLSY